MLEFLGIVGGNILSLPGILGLALGMTTRRIWLGALLGCLVGFAETLIFAHYSFAQIEFLELSIALFVGLLAGTLGSIIRVYGATV